MIKAKIKLFFKSEFAVALSTTSFTTAIQMLAGLVINKILAVTIGPGGIAMMGQFTNFKELATNLANGSFGQGVTKYVADPSINNRNVIATSNLFTLFVSSIISILSILFASTLSQLLFKSSQYSSVFMIFGLLLPFFALNNLLISTVNGYREFKTLAKLKVTNSMVSLIMSGALAWFFLLKGALIAQAVNTSIVFLISFALIFQNRNTYFSFNYLFFDKYILNKLLAFTLMALTSAQLKPFVQLFLRDYIITHSNEFDAGIWEATKRFSQFYVLIITTALGAYYLPKLSSLTTNIALKKEIISGIKIIMPLFILIALLIYILKGWIIQLLFSVEFLPMEELILPQLIGDFLMIFSFMIAYLMLAKAMVKVFMISQLIFAGIRILLSIIFFNIGGIEGIIWANAANYFLYTCFVLLLFRNIFFRNNTD